MTSDRIRSQRGMTLVMVCLLLFAFLGIAAICVDLGILYSARTSAQHAADAGALAGAATFLDPSAVQPDVAKAQAVAVTNANKILGHSIAITVDNVDVSMAFRRVTVTVLRSGDSAINTLFAKALGISSVPIQAQATAEASASATAASCVKPVFMPNTILSTNPNACNTSPKQIIFDPANPGHLSTWAANAAGTFGKVGTCVSARPISASNALAPSQFYSLDFGSGASTYSDAWGQCLSSVPTATVKSVSCGQSIPLETGNMVGPTRQGVSNFIGNPPDKWIPITSTTPISEASPNFYQPGDGGSPITTSRSLAVVPVYDNCSPPGNAIGPGCSGTCEVTVIGFLEIFVDGMGTTPTCTVGSGGQFVVVHAVNAPTCSAGGSSGSGSGGTGPFAVPVRLINPALTPAP